MSTRPPSYCIPGIRSLPTAGAGGWVGYTGYDTVRYTYPRKIPFSDAPKDDRNLLDMQLGLYKDVVVFDNATKLVYIVAWGEVAEGGASDAVQQAWQAAVARVRLPAVTGLRCAARHHKCAAGLQCWQALQPRMRSALRLAWHLRLGTSRMGSATHASCAQSRSTASHIHASLFAWRSTNRPPPDCISRQLPAGARAAAATQPAHHARACVRRRVDEPHESADAAGALQHDARGVYGGRGDNAGACQSGRRVPARAEPAL